MRSAAPSRATSGVKKSDRTSLNERHQSVRRDWSTRWEELGDALFAVHPVEAQKGQGVGRLAAVPPQLHWLVFDPARTRAGRPRPRGRARRRRAARAICRRGSASAQSGCSLPPLAVVRTTTHSGRLQPLGAPADARETPVSTKATPPMRNLTFPGAPFSRLRSRSRHFGHPPRTPQSHPAYRPRRSLRITGVTNRHMPTRQLRYLHTVPGRVAVTALGPRRRAQSTCLHAVEERLHCNSPSPFARSFASTPIECNPRCNCILGWC